MLNALQASTHSQPGSADTAVWIIHTAHVQGFVDPPPWQYLIQGKGMHFSMAAMQCTCLLATTNPMFCSAEFKPCYARLYHRMPSTNMPWAVKEHHTKTAAVVLASKKQALPVTVTIGDRCLYHIRPSRQLLNPLTIYNKDLLPTMYHRVTHLHMQTASDTEHAHMPSATIGGC